jgi:hypothetical protein
VPPSSRNRRSRAGQAEGSAGVAALADSLRDLPEKLRPRVRPMLRSAGEQVARDARRNASWSTRIPGSIAVRVSFTGRRPGVLIVARKAIAPHARAYEGITGRATLRHPVFGDREVWVAQPVRPFLAPAVGAYGPKLADDAARAVDEAARDAGFT